jgi:hypothetical protein
VRSFFTISKWHAFGAPGRPAPAGLVQWARAAQGMRWTVKGCWAVGGWNSEGVSPSWDGSLARCLSVGTHGAGRCLSAVTPHPPPARPPTVTHPRWPRLQEQPDRPPAPDTLTPRKDHNQGRTSSLRCGRSTLILIFHGKIRHLPGRRGEG